MDARNKRGHGVACLCGTGQEKRQLLSGLGVASPSPRTASAKQPQVRSVGRTLSPMTPLVYPMTSETFPRAGLIDVPCFSTTSYDGNTAILEPKGISVPLDFSALTPEVFQKATHKQGRDVELRGLAALETRWLQEVPDVTWRPPYRKPLGARVGGRWYYVTPLCPDIMLETGVHTVVGLFG